MYICNIISNIIPVYSLWHSYAIWRHKSGSTLLQVMAWCLTAPSHSPNLCWLINITTQRHSRRVIPQQSITKKTLKISFKFTRGPIQWVNECCGICHYSDVIMSSLTSQITSVSIVYPTVSSSADQRKHQSSASLAFVMGIHRWPVNSPHKGPVTWECFHLMTLSRGRPLCEPKNYNWITR